MRVNAILPGAVAGEHTQAAIAARSEMNDVAALALFLCSPAARNLTGQAVGIHHQAEYL